MNKKIGIGDLIRIYNSNNYGVIIKKDFFPEIKEHMYKIHFCEEDEPDQRWLFFRDLVKI